MERASAPVVATKLLAPRAPQQCVVRHRLLDVIDRGVRGPLTLLSAPAGAGKTELLASWLSERTPPGPVCWLTIDRDDADPVRFWGGALAALQGAGDGTGLSDVAAPAGSLDECFLPALVNALAALPRPCVLVLDDLHEIAGAAVVDQLGWLLQQAPEPLRVVLATRTDPTLRLARARVSGALTELRAADLAFTLDEARALYEQMRLELADADLTALLARTEGWAAGLRLAALSLADHHDPARFVAEFAHGDQAVADFLATEVLDKQPPEVLDFLLRTCVADELNPQLTATLAGTEDGSEILAGLERANAFVQLLDTPHETYRYHPMFRDLLRARLHHSRPGEAVELHSRAAAWYAERQQALPAIRHALAAGASQQAGALVSEHWLRLFADGSSTALRELLLQLPGSIAGSDPELAAVVADSRLEAGDLDDADALLAVAGERAGEIPATRRERFAAVLAAATLHRARLRGDLQSAVGSARTMLELARGLDGDDASVRASRCVALAHLGAAELWWERPGHARKHLDEALALAYACDAEQVQLDCLGQLAVVEIVDGRLTRAQTLSDEALALAARRGWSARQETACAQLAAGIVALQAGEAGHATSLLEGAALAARNAEAPVQIAVALAQAITLAAEGAEPARRGRLKLLAARQLAERFPVPGPLRSALVSCEARTLLAAGETARARTTLEDAYDEVPWPDHALIAQARIDLHDGEPRAALASLDLAIDAEPHPALLVEANLLRAIVHHGAREREATHAAVEQSLACAEAEPLRLAFLTGPGVHDLLAQHARTAYPDLLAELLDGDVTAPPSIGTGQLAEALTDRERAVLRLLPTMLTHAEIASELFVSVNTVKTHVRGIYRKLGVARRAEAVARARQLSLLSAGIARTAPARPLTPSG